MNVSCPYCGDSQAINSPSPIREYKENVLHRRTCPACEKTFSFQIVVSVEFKSQKADCLNDGEHSWAPTETRPIEFTDMYCIGCGQTRKPTPTELEAIMQAKRPA